MYRHNESGPVVTITEAMATGVDMMCKHMSLTDQMITVGKPNLDTTLDGIADRFSTKEKLTLVWGKNR